jgi:hypothetical protein
MREQGTSGLEDRCGTGHAGDDGSGGMPVGRYRKEARLGDQASNVLSDGWNRRACPWLPWYSPPTEMVRPALQVVVQCLSTSEPSQLAVQSPFGR